VKINDRIYFQAYDSIHGSELWKTDGTELGTVLVSDVLPGNLSSSPSNIILVGNEILFMAESKDFGRQIWKIPNNELNRTKETINEQKISIYPNPSVDYIQIKTIPLNNDIFIYNITGQLISVEKATNNTINISNLHPGLYYLKFNVNGQTVSKKIIKQND
ncbi:MAG: T9SS type A sorting domain-containing protein, partial [Bacteroidales bacterium]|nr:T9SS type A sorting domain-containing protein [Bacteroidales bacterium]